MLEQRRYTRLIIKSMDMKCKLHFDAEAKVVNISLDGACISSDRPLKIGSNYELRLMSGNEVITVDGEIVWEKIVQPKKDAKGSGKAPVYHVGIKFRDVLTDKGRHILDFLKENSLFKRLKLRLKGVRVKIIKPKTRTVLTDYRNYTVVKLSLGGMLLETDRPMKLEDRHTMELSLPKSKQPIKFKGRIASCAEIPNEIPRRYGSGIEFFDMSDRDRARLSRFINLLLNIK
ncbi:MAG TPA: hypothetical protein ENH40_00740 [Nitrospirae bacterium]|nr:hypothetical protein [Nitrospirota bacterium]